MHRQVINEKLTCFSGEVQFYLKIDKIQIIIFVTTQNPKWNPLKSVFPPKNFLNVNFPEY